MKKALSLISCVALLSAPVFSLESLDDETLSGAIAREGVDIRVNYEGEAENLYFETKDGADAFRFNLGGFRLDTDNTGNNPIDLTMDLANTDLLNGIDITISGVEHLDLYADKIGVQKNNGTPQIFGTLGLEDVSFHGGTASMSLLSVPGDGDEGLMLRLSLPEGTTGNVILGDETAKLSALLEINEFSVVQTVDLVDLDPTAGEDLALKMIISEMETSFDVKQIKVQDSAGVVHRAGSYGQLSVDKLHVKSGYTIVDSIQY